MQHETITSTKYYGAIKKSTKYYGIVMNNICMDVHNQKTLRIPSHDYTMLCNSHIEGF